MSMHKKPLTVLEEAGLAAHHLPMGTPSQLADSFRHGVAWALAVASAEPNGLADSILSVHDFKEGQWWWEELAARLEGGTPDQKRSLYVVRNLLRVAHAAVPKEVPEGTMKPFRLVAVHSGGDWSDASAYYLKVPADMDISAQKARYDEWYRNGYCRTLNTPFKVSFMGFEAWPRQHGAVEAADEGIEVFSDD